jgi:hypothetical protein
MTVVRRDAQRDTEREQSIPAVIPLATGRSHSVAPRPTTSLGI